MVFLTKLMLTAWTPLLLAPSHQGVVAFLNSNPLPKERMPALSHWEILSSTSSSSSSSSTTSSTKVEQKKDDDPTLQKPLTEHWWPVIALTALDPSRPNALQVLGRKLVAYHDTTTSWNVLDDRCSHRFAPLSEGRLVVADSGNATNLQCAYHGWEFTSCGTCACVPQEPTNSRTARSVRTYPVQERAGMLWVWTGDKDAITTGLPISALLDRHHEAFGDASCFMRDLPYGMEILGENLLDLSHLPYSHHSVGSLKRELGKELAMKRFTPKEGPNAPSYIVQVKDAGRCDPILMGVPDSQGTRESWTSYISFYSPCHIRYERSRGPGQAINIELFMCPLSEGKSRVFLFNCFESVLPSSEDPSLTMILRKPNLWKSSLRKTLIQQLVKPSRVSGHLVSHKIFDGDGIFLHKQGNRMHTHNLSFRDYSTPSSADILLNAYRRHLDKMAMRSDALSASTVHGQYDDTAPRSVLLDRYSTHTVHCPLCSTALAQSRRKKQWIMNLRASLRGATGALAALSISSVVGMVQSVATRSVTAATVLSAVATYLLGRMESRTEKRIQSFLFEDYVHADKD